MTQPGLGPLAPVAGRLSGPEALSADPLVDPGTTKAIEGQIALLTKRIKSIADYLQVWMVCRHCLVLSVYAVLAYRVFFSNICFEEISSMSWCRRGF